MCDGARVMLSFYIVKSWYCEDNLHNLKSPSFPCNILLFKSILKSNSNNSMHKLFLLNDVAVERKMCSIIRLTYFHLSRFLTWKIWLFPTRLTSFDVWWKKKKLKEEEPGDEEPADEKMESPV